MVPGYTIHGFAVAILQGCVFRRAEREANRGVPWMIGYPHPYFVNKFLVFLRLQVGLRRKILITKKFPAKSSRIRSYVTFRPLLAASVLKRGAKRTCRDDDLKEDF
jgi:hypothetical protein